MPAPPLARRTAAAAIAMFLLLALPAASSALLRRLDDRYLAALSRDAAALRAAARPSDRSGELLDLRCVLHAHSRLSHDATGTEAEIVAAARAARVRAVFMTEHPTPDRRWWTEGLRGEKDGVLFVPGAELSDGLLVWRGEKAEWTPDMKAAEVLERLRGTDAVAFVAHPEQRKTDPDWALPPFAGMEIYNTHADATDSGYEQIQETLRSAGPARLLALLVTVKRYPQETFAAVFDEPTALLQRWDRLNAAWETTGRKIVGIAGNDSHRNVALSAEASEEGIRVRDAFGKVVAELPKRSLPLFLFAQPPPGTVLLAHTFDPYEVSFGYVSTHLLAPEPTEAALFDALLAGRAYVAFDWMADPSGFRFFASRAEGRVEMGGEVRAADRPLLTVRAPIPCRLRLLRHGEEVKRVEDAELTFEVTEPGVYRAEAWLRLADEWRPWVYTNPIYAR